MKKDEIYYLPYFYNNEVYLTIDDETVSFINSSIVFNGLIDDDIKYYFTLNNKEQFVQSFDSIIINIYDYPESFKLSKSDLECYSSTEIKYMKKLKYFLLAIGLKDAKENEDFKNRSTDNFLFKYSNYQFYYDDNAIDIINGKKNKLISDVKNKNVEENSYMFLFDSDNNYYGTIKTNNNIIVNQLVGEIEVLTKFDNKNSLFIND